MLDTNVLFLDARKNARTQKMLFLQIFLLTLISNLDIVEAQFPAVCVVNATAINARCCPTPQGYFLPCGGPGRGRCVFIEDQIIPRMAWAHLRNDDRLNWPKKFFQYVCLCENNFDGYQCTECLFGYGGPNCKNKRTYIRRNAVSLNVAERKLLLDVFNTAKTMPSEWVAMNLTSFENIDPIKELVFYRLTVYDYFSYFHYYSARDTMNPLNCTGGANFSHGGTGFLTWHRLFLLFVERELRKIASSQFNENNFALPYWDWFDDGQKCEVCTDDLFGADPPDPNIKRLSNMSPLYNWKLICPVGHLHKCSSCDTTKDNGYLYRQFAIGKDGKKVDRNLPTKEEYDFLMSRQLYDTFPYNINSDSRGFRAVLEGYIRLPDGTIHRSMHNIVHKLSNGILKDGKASTNDPIFYAHHSFVDKLLETYIRKNRPSRRQYPKYGVPFGHGRDDIMIPFFPPFHTHAMILTDSRNLGFDYDTMDLQKHD